MIYLVLTPALEESITLIGWPEAVVCSEFLSFDRICAQMYLFLDALHQSCMEEVNYQKDIYGINFSLSNN